MKPHLVIFAGPNGSGKTTLYKEVLSQKSLKGIEYVNPDEYAIKYGSEVAGAKEALRHRSKLLRERKSFITETTLSGNSALKLMRKAKDAGYKVTLFYISTDNPKVNILSVKLRVATGGHDVPTDAIVRRHAASLENLPTALKLRERSSRVSSRTYENASGVFSDKWFSPTQERRHNSRLGTSEIENENSRADEEYGPFKIVLSRIGERYKAIISGVHWYQ